MKESQAAGEENQRDSDAMVEWKAAVEMLRKAGPGITKVALFPPEASGTAEDVSGLTSEIIDVLGGEEKLALLEPEKTLACAGAEFPLDSEGLAQAAKRCGTDAILLVRIFKTPRRYEILLWMVGADGRVFLDVTAALEKLPPPPEPETVSEGGTADSRAIPEKGQGEDASSRDAAAGVPLLRIVWQGQEVSTSASVAVGGANFSAGLTVPVGRRGGWQIFRGGEPISEAELLRLANDSELTRQVERRVARMRNLRNWGIGLTLAGFVAAGIATPYFKQGTNEGVTAAGAVVVAGLLCGTSGLYLWLNYAPAVSSFKNPNPVYHFLTPEKARELVDEINRRNKAVGTDQPKASFMLAPVAGGAQAVLGFSF